MQQPGVLLRWPRVSVLRMSECIPTHENVRLTTRNSYPNNERFRPGDVRDHPGKQRVCPIEPKRYQTERSSRPANLSPRRTRTKTNSAEVSYRWRVGSICPPELTANLICSSSDLTTRVIHPATQSVHSFASRSRFITQRAVSLVALAAFLLAHSASAGQHGSHHKVLGAIFTSPCTCRHAYGHSRWAAKTETVLPPLLGIRKLTPADMCTWRGPEVQLTSSSPRIPAERKCYAVTGRIIRIYIENDGDLHLVLQNTDGRRGRIVAEIPVGTSWCKIRQTVFSWTNARFPILPRDRQSIHAIQHPIATVVGRAFYDIDHASRVPRSNRRDYDHRIAVWEIHPVMRLIQ